MKRILLFASIFCLLAFTSCNNSGSKGENQSEASTEKDSLEEVPDQNIRPTGDGRSVPEATSKDTTDTK